MLSPQEWPFAVETGHRDTQADDAERQGRRFADEIADCVPRASEARHPNAKTTTIISTIVYGTTGMERYQTISDRDRFDT